MLKETGCHGVMVARSKAALDIRGIIHYLKSNKLEEPSVSERINIAVKHLNLAVKLKGENRVIEMRKHLAWYLKGMKMQIP